MKNKLGLRPGDFVLFALILLGACLIWVRFAMLQTDRVYGEIWHDGACIERVALSDSYHEVFEVQGDQTMCTIRRTANGCALWSRSAMTTPVSAPDGCRVWETRRFVCPIE